MGFHWKALGYRSVLDFVAHMRRSEDDQLDAMARYIKSNRLDGALRRHDWARFARGYNGAGYKSNRYDEKLANAYNAFSSEDEQPNWRLREAQLYLSYLNYYSHAGIDGDWGPRTASGLEQLYNELRDNNASLLPQEHQRLDFSAIDDAPDWLFDALRRKIVSLGEPRFAAHAFPAPGRLEPPDPDPEPETRPESELRVGAEHRVAVERLNLRSAPQTGAATLIGELHMAQPVELLEADNNSKWARVRATVDGAQKEGVVWAAFLRKTVEPGREAVIAAAVEQWLRFDRGKGKETVDPYAGYVGEMWRHIGGGFAEFTGRDTQWPWSAAAISFMVRKASESYPKYANFKFAAAHARYIHDSINRREAKDETAPFWGFRLDERKPQLGDMVCRGRGSEITYDHAKQQNGFKSHCDIIVQIKEDQVLAIGGNVSNSVSIAKYGLNSSGYLSGAGGVFALLANMT